MSGKIERAHREWMNALDAVRDPIFLYDEHFRILRCNRAYQQRTGLPFEKIIGNPYYEIFPKTELPLAFRRQESADAEAVGSEDEEVRVGGTVYRSRTFDVTDEETGKIYFLHILEDVTERKETEESLRRSEANLRESEKKFHGIAGAALDAIIMADNAGRVTYWNPSATRILGYKEDEVMGRNLHDIITPPRYRDSHHAAFGAFAESGKGAVVGKTLELEALHKNGSEFPIELSVAAIHLSGGWHAVGVLRDISDRKRAEEELLRSERNLSEAQHLAQVGSWELDHKTGVITWSDETYRIFEVDPKNFGASYEAFLNIIHPEDRAKVDRAFSQHIDSGAPYDVVHRLLFPDDRIKYVHERCETDFQDGRAVRSLGSAQDITERQLSEIHLSNLNRTLQTLSSGNSVLVHAKDEETLLNDMCAAIVNIGGYALAWVGMVENDEDKSVRPVAHAGSENGYLKRLRVSWGDNELGQGPTGRAARLGTIQVVEDTHADPRFSPWREIAQRYGYGSSIALPLKTEDGKVFAVLNIYAHIRHGFNEAEIKLIHELAEDLAYGVSTRRADGERKKQNQESARQLREALIGTIRAISLTVEKRDSYTAGHQNRVANIAASIGKELGLDGKAIEGLKLGGLIHDIGKISIPAEILSRPGRLSSPEFEMIKTHPSVGYDIVKDTAFPWPIGEMILQHHERLDGSGYPRGLKGDEIIQEARILTVADVVEAISAHRPYRPALGIEAALTEIEKGREKYYDRDVADSCLRLFREKGFQLTSTEPPK